MSNEMLASGRVTRRTLAVQPPVVDATARTSAEAAVTEAVSARVRTARLENPYSHRLHTDDETNYASVLSEYRDENGDLLLDPQTGELYEAGYEFTDWTDGGGTIREAEFSRLYRDVPFVTVQHQTTNSVPVLLPGSPPQSHNIIMSDRPRSGRGEELPLSDKQYTTETGVIHNGITYTRFTLTLEPSQFGTTRQAFNVVHRYDR